MPPIPHRRSRLPPPIAYASPLKAPSNRKLGPRPAKRQRLSESPLKAGRGRRARDSRSSSYGDENDPIILAGSSSSASDGEVVPLRESDLALAGARSNRAGGKTPRRKDAKGKGPELRLKKKKSQLLASVDAVSPRKRKREVDDDLDAPGDSDDDFESYDGSESVRSSEVPRDEYTEVDPVFMQDDDDNLIHHATRGQLSRLRKAELIRLHKVAGIWLGDTESVESDSLEEEQEGKRKVELVEAIVAARASAPPPIPDAFRVPRNGRSALLSRFSSNQTSDSYPSRRRSSCSSEGPSVTGSRPRSSDPFVNGDGRKSNLKAKRKTLPGITPKSRKTRFGDVTTLPNGHGTAHKARATSFTSSTASTAAPGPGPSTAASRSKAKTRARTSHGRNGVIIVDDDENEAFDDEEWQDQDHSTTASGSHSDGSGVQVISRTPRPRAAARRPAEDADDERDGEVVRRRSSGVRHTPARRAKKRAIKAIKVLDDDADVNMDAPESNVELEDSELEDATPRVQTRARLAAIAAPMPRTPISRRLRQPREPASLASPSTEDDIQVFDDDHSSVSEPEVDDAMEDTADETRESSPTSSHGDSDHPARRLRSRTRRLRRTSRNGSLEMRLHQMDLDEADDADEAIEEVDEDMSERTEQASEDMDTSTIDGNDDPLDDADDEGGDAAEEDDLNLLNATHATLLRLKKADLIRMCESRELCTDGTKTDLVEALIQWRDATERGSEAPSSTSTARAAAGKPAASAIAGATRSKNNEVPVLLRDHVHAVDPATPPLSEEADAGNDDVILDLEELGLVNKEIPAAQITKGDKIGLGGYKDVFMGKLRGRAKVAICEFRDEMSDMDIRELKLLADFNHPNIVRLLGVSIPDKASGTPCMVITELCENGDLFDYIRNVPAPTFVKVLRLMINIAEGLEYLHERKPKVIHRDCKSTNILINRRGVAKVADFGLARVKSTTRSVIRSLVGTVNWQAPELWHPNPKYDYKVDVFSCAMVYWEMLSGWVNEKKTYPWEGRNEHWIYDAVGRQKQRPPVTNLRKHWGNDIIDLVERMWLHDPAERPTMTNVIDDLKAILAEAK